MIVTTPVTRGEQGPRDTPLGSPAAPVPPPPSAPPMPPPPSVRPSTAGAVSVRRGLIIALAAAIPAAGIVGVAIGSAVTASNSTAQPSPRVVVTTVYVPTPVPIAAEPTGEPTSVAPAVPAKPSIEDGQWIVGTDFPAGTYETRTDSTDCYWDITKSGSNHSTYVDQQVGIGHYRVKLKVGQDFTTLRCGVWTKVG